MDMNPAYEFYKMQYHNAGIIPCARLAHSYVPYQVLMCIYSPMRGLRQGTIFPELDRPYGADPEYMVDA